MVRIEYKFEINLNKKYYEFEGLKCFFMSRTKKKPPKSSTRYRSELIIMTCLSFLSLPIGSVKWCRKYSLGSGCRRISTTQAWGAICLASNLKSRIEMEIREMQNLHPLTACLGGCGICWLRFRKQVSRVQRTSRRSWTKRSAQRRADVLSIKSRDIC